MFEAIFEKMARDFAGCLVTLVAFTAISSAAIGAAIMYFLLK